MRAFVCFSVLLIGCLASCSCHGDADGGTRADDDSLPPPRSASDGKSPIPGHDAGNDDAAPGTDAEASVANPSGYAAPGTEPGVPGPSTRILQPDSNVTRLVAGPGNWLLMRSTRGIHRVPPSVEELDLESGDAQILDRGSFWGPWVNGDFVFWFDREERLMRFDNRTPFDVEADSLDEHIDAFPLQIPREPEDKFSAMEGAAYDGDLYLAAGGCAIFARVDASGETLATLRSRRIVVGGNDSIAVDASGVYCVGHWSQARTLVRLDHELTSVTEVWTLPSNSSRSGGASVSDIVAVGGKVYWTVLPGAYPTPAEMYAYDPESNEVELVTELVTQAPKRMQTDRPDKIYWKASGFEGDVLRVFDIGSSEAVKDLEADFGLDYIDKLGEEQTTYLQDFVLSVDFVYWYRSNPGSRPNDAGDDIMRLPRSLLEP